MADFGDYWRRVRDQAVEFGRMRALAIQEALANPRDHRRPRLHRLRTWDLSGALRQRPDHEVRAFTWGPISIMWDRGFKQAEKERGQ